MEPVIDPDELIIGTPDLSPLDDVERNEAKALEPVRRAMPHTGGRRGHMTLDWGKLLSVGINGLVTENEALRNNLDLNERDALAKDEFYEGCLVELRALLTLADSYVRKAKLLGRDDLVDILTRVPANGATTFREALQSIHFFNFCLWDLYFYGRVDQYLLPFYQADITAGRLNTDQAQELIDCFYLISAKYITPQSVQVVTLGGYDSQGHPVDNALTRHFLQAVTHAPVAVAQTALLVNRHTQDDVLTFAIDALSKGFSQPQLYNDDLIVASMRHYGFGEEESYYYANCGCVEIVPCDCSGIWPVSPYHNLVKMLLESLQTQSNTFEQLMGRFSSIVRREVVKGNIQERQWQMERARTGSECLRASCLVHDCLKRGLSVDEGGARYNHIQPNFLGLSNVVDSLAVINELVFEKHELSINQFIDILEKDYDGYENLRNRIIHRLPHFGTNEKITDNLARRVAIILQDSCKGLTGYRSDDPLIPGAFSYNEHAKHGARTGASPDGRKAGYPLAAGSSPVQGRETKGPTAALLSAVQWDQAAFIGGVANNIMFSKSQLDAHGKENILALIKTFFSMGGFQIQINVTDKEVLEKARQNPEQYRDLLVRVGGFNAYFVGCSPQLQQEIIDRNEHII